MSRDAVQAIEAASGQTHAKEEAAAREWTQIELPAHFLVKSPALGRGWVESPTAHHMPNLVRCDRGEASAATHRLLGLRPPRQGDRAANVGSPTVPFGLRGTVVAIHASTGNVEVVFDTFFVDGSTLHGLCSRGRGFFLPWAHLLNLSKKAPVHGEVGPCEPFLFVRD